VSDIEPGVKVKAGSSIVYTVTAQNTGTVALAGVVVFDDMSDVLDNATLVTRPSLAAGVLLVTGGEGWMWFGDLAVDEKVTFTYSVSVDDGATAEDQIANRVTTNMPGNCKAGSEDPACSVVIEPQATTPATGVKTVPKLYLVAGKSVTLPGVVQPLGARNPDVVWTSTNPAVVKVDASGKVTAGAKAGGKNATVTVTSVDGGFSANCKVYVVKKASKVKSFKVPASGITGLVVGQTMQVMPTSLKPSKATNVVPVFASSDVSVAVIDKAGVVTALAPGKTTIMVKAGGKTKTFVLTVGTSAPSQIWLDSSSASVKRGAKIALHVSAWTPVDADPQTVVWTSSNKKIATVNADGVVTGKKRGKATITATTWNGKKVKCTVTVK